MADEFARYRTNYGEFAALLTHATDLIELQSGYKPRGDRDVYAERILGKLVCHGLSLKRLSPSPTLPGGELWDISSNYAIARTLIETYEALSYIALEPVEVSEREFRVLLWKLHAQERRREMLRLIGSNHPEIKSLESEVSELRNAVLGHQYLSSAGGDIGRKVQRGETPPYHLSRAERDVRCGINRDYHTVVIMHLSSHVHTHPFSVHQLFEFKAGDPECLQLMGVPLQYSSAFLAKAIVGVRGGFMPRVPLISESFMKTLDLWTDILSKGVKIER
jgi:hypothetical protein